MPGNRHLNDLNTPGLQCVKAMRIREGPRYFYAQSRVSEVFLHPIHFLQK
jgi:hypothetical protein